MQSKKTLAFTLSELLIAMALGTIIALGLTQLYQQHNKSYQYQLAMMTATQSGMLASLQLQSVLQKSGYVGCLSLENQQIISHDDQVSVPIQPLKLIPLSQLPLDVARRILNESDALQVSYMSENYSALLQDMQSPHSLIVSPAIEYHVGERVIVSNCGHADIFVITQVYHRQHQQIIYTEASLGQYKQGDMVAAWLQPIFYLANTSRKQQDGQPIPALYWHQANGDDEELQENVTSLKIQQIRAAKTSMLKTQIVLATQMQDETFRQKVQLPWQFASYNKVQSLP